MKFDIDMFTWKFRENWLRVLSMHARFKFLNPGRDAGPFILEMFIPLHRSLQADQPRFTYERNKILIDK